MRYKMGISRFLKYKLLLVILLVLAGLSLVAYLELTRLRRVQKFRYRKWLSDNQIRYEEFKRIATRENWKLVVADRNSVGILDFSNEKYRTIYSSHNHNYTYIQHAERLSENKVCVLEEQYDQEMAFVVIIDIEKEKEELRLPVSRGYIDLIISLWPSKPVLETDAYVIFPDGEEIVRYDKKSKKREVVLRTEDYTAMAIVYESAGLLYMNIQSNEREEYFVVVKNQKPFDQIARVDNVENLVVVGKHILLQQGTDIVEFSPENKKTTFIADGTLLGPLGMNAFFYTDAHFPPYSGALKKYDLDERRAAVLLTQNEFKISTIRTYCPFVTRDLNYVFVADITHSHHVLHDHSFRIYDIRSARQVGAFYNPYLGKYSFHYVLGWTK